MFLHPYFFKILHLGCMWKIHQPDKIYASHGSGGSLCRSCGYLLTVYSRHILLFANSPKRVLLAAKPPLPLKLMTNGFWTDVSSITGDQRIGRLFRKLLPLRDHVSSHSLKRFASFKGHRSFTEASLWASTTKYLLHCLKGLYMLAQQGSRFPD